MLKKKKRDLGNSPAIQLLGCRALTAKGPGSIPGQGTKNPQTACPRPQEKERDLEWKHWQRKHYLLGLTKWLCYVAETNTTL